MTKKIQMILVTFTVVLAACTPTTTTINKESTYDFDKTGTLTRNMPGLTPGVWYISYEEENAPELTMRLSFDEDTICKDGTTTGPCDRSVFENKLDVRIRAMRTNDGVLVKEMEIQ